MCIRMITQSPGDWNPEPKHGSARPAAAATFLICDAGVPMIGLVFPCSPHEEGEMDGSLRCGLQRFHGFDPYCF